MEITFTLGELATLDSLSDGAESQEDVVHRLLVPYVKNYTESSLQKIADIYRSLTPELQATALQAVLKWQAVQQALDAKA